jgi:putative endonuclease
MYKVYILNSILKNKYYVGHTRDINERIERHNKGLVKSTKNYRPWKIIYTEDFVNKNDAYRREFQIKSYKGGSAFKKLIKETG